MSLTTITKRAAAGLAVAGISIGIMAASVGASSAATAWPSGPYATTGPAPTNDGVIIHDAGVIIRDQSQDGIAVAGVVTAAALPEDSFTRADNLGSTFQGSIGVNNFDSTAEPGEPSHASTPSGANDLPDHSIWFKWKSPVNGNVVFRTRDSNFDTVMAAYTGTSITALTQVATNDDTDMTLFNGTVSHVQSQISFPAVKDTTYSIAVDSFTGSLAPGQVETGRVRLSWNANNDFGAAQPLPGPSGTAVSSEPGDTTGATAQAGEPPHAGQVGGRSIWYSWRAPKSGAVSFNTSQSDIDTLLAAYKGSGVGQLTELASNDNASPQTKTSKITFIAVAGVTYKIAVDGKNAAAGITILRYAYL